MPEADKTAEKLEEYKNSLIAEAEELVFNQFPKKVLEMNDLLKDEKFEASRISQIGTNLEIPYPEDLLKSDKYENHVPPQAKRQKLDGVAVENTIEGTKVLGFVTGTIPSNSKLLQLIDVVKPVIYDALENVNKLKMWISFLIPRIEDGNNFGVSIQEETLGEVRQVESEVASFLDQISRYMLTRGRIVTKIAKYPHVEDYRRSIQDLDEKEFINLRLVLMEVRNHYSSLHDIIIKNLEKIKKPRSSNMEHLY